MATLRVCLKRPLCRFQNSNRLICTTAVSLKGPTKHAYKPGNYPTTPEERLAAAKKYGLHVDDYIPIKDDGFGAGDYPDLEPKSFSARDPYYDWDYPGIRRNYNEARAADEEYYKGYRYDCSKKYYFSLPQQTFIFFVFVVTASLLFNYLPKNPSHTPMMAKQFPYGRVPAGSLHLEKGDDNATTYKHYTFEPAE